MSIQWINKTPKNEKHAFKTIKQDSVKISITYSGYKSKPFVARINFHKNFSDKFLANEKYEESYLELGFDNDEKRLYFHLTDKEKGFKIVNLDGHHFVNICYAKNRKNLDEMLLPFIGTQIVREENGEYFIDLKYKEENEE